jgi:hypothetical protein
LRFDTAIVLAAAIAIGLWCPAQIRLLDDTDRSACRSWLVVLADAQFYRPTADVTDCAGLCGTRCASPRAIPPVAPP